jgi:hypothetical protein
VCEWHCEWHCPRRGQRHRRRVDGTGRYFVFGSSESVGGVHGRGQRGQIDDADGVEGYGQEY